ncbi:hypothetical protein Rhal01_01272 [Rubritalea halochordaticola]|uniref:Ice-binding protein C-terminal domain-containing protein n=1 Tax=Rubritalea halochordaticola TaxID=714537 RepID=A0ABP9UZE7_9BACT
MKKHNILLPALFLAATPAFGAITLTKAVEDFDYIYTMDVAPNNQDLDSNGTDDWWDTGVPTVSGGFATNTAADQIFRGDFTGSIWRSVVSDNTGTVAWTMEITVGKVGGTQGTNGWFGIATDVEGPSSAIYIKDDRISIEQGAVDLDFLVGTDFTTGYHTVRIAHDAEAGGYYYWVNGTLLNDDTSTPIAPGNGSFSGSQSTFIGDYGGAISGDYSIDSLSLTSGAYAAVAVPEPSTSLLGVIGVGALLLRRRRA